jgi:hypothetical protein
VTCLAAQAAAALAKARASRRAGPETVPRLPDLARPVPVLPRHAGRYHGLLPDLKERTAVAEEIAGLVPGQRTRTGVAVR